MVICCDRNREGEGQMDALRSLDRPVAIDHDAVDRARAIAPAALERREDRVIQDRFDVAAARLRRAASSAAWAPKAAERTRLRARGQDGPGRNLTLDDHAVRAPDAPVLRDAVRLLDQAPPAQNSVRFLRPTPAIPIEVATNWQDGPSEGLTN
jgi:hypothetical protein